jgi:hypothetical protein
LLVIMAHAVIIVIMDVTTFSWKFALLRCGAPFSK